MLSLLAEELKVGKVRSTTCSSKEPHQLSEDNQLVERRQTTAELKTTHREIIPTGKKKITHLLLEARITDKHSINRERPSEKQRDDSVDKKYRGLLRAGMFEKLLEDFLP